MTRERKRFSEWKAPVCSHHDRVDLEDTVNVAFYGRVSSQHQLDSFDNQMDWYHMLLKMHPNWRVVREYTDKGITGTLATKRPGFMQMIKDVESGKNDFSLIVTREVCRFARNTVDSLAYTRELKKHNVEVFFYNDGIWSMDPDGEIRLIIYSALAQDESRKTSERTKSGVMTSQEKGVLFGNGNILGYDLQIGESSIDNTYVINSEQADTVRMIYKWYAEGYGMKKIISKLVEQQRVNTIGKVRWDTTTIARILRNKTYAGYKCYNKSEVSDFLEHSRKNNLDEDTYRYIKGDWEPIIPLDEWEKVQKIRRSKQRPCARNGKGKNPAGDKWTRKLRCECNHTFKKYQWRTNKNGEIIYGYQCRNQVDHRKKSYHIKCGGTGEGFCDVPSICQWKLEYQLSEILKRLWKNPKATIESLYDSIEENYEEDIVQIADQKQERLKNEKERLEIRLDNLVDKWLDGAISQEIYDKKSAEINERLAELQEELSELEVEASREDVSEEERTNNLNAVRELLKKCSYLEQEMLADELIEKFVERVIPTENRSFKWYMNFGKPSEGNFQESEYIQLETFELHFEDARAYRKSFGRYLRKNQWKDISVEVYIRA